MIITRTPFRVSLFGGGTDYPSYFQNSEHGGAVLGFALDRYCYITVRRLPPFFAHRHRLAYSRIELVNSLDEVAHPTARAVLTEMRDLIGDDGLEIHHDGDLPARSGLGSSSSFVVGLVHAVRALYGSRSSPGWLRDEAIRIERDVAGEAVGSQDQSFASHGGLRRIDFRPDGSVQVRTVTSPGWEDSLIAHLMLVFTGVTRVASLIAEAQVLRTAENRAHLDRMRGLVDTAQALASGSVEPGVLGELLHESWVLKRSLSGLVSTPYIDGLYDAARTAGATGGKILGAGGGGFLLLMVPPERREGVRAALRERTPVYVEVPVRVAREGSSVVLDEPNGL